MGISPGHDGHGIPEPADLLWILGNVFMCEYYSVCDVGESWIDIAASTRWRWV
ncbi:unnamed protein product [Discosporangium mesarthrocarpum]